MPEAQPPAAGSGAAARPAFSSGYAAVCATAGVAIGLGNIWRFPYMMGKYGGAAFLLVYLLIVVAFGVPILMAEWALGRHTRRGPWQAFERAGMPAGRFFSAIVLITVVMAASYYGVVLAWVLYMAVALGGRAIAFHESAGSAALSGEFATNFMFVVMTVALGCGSLLLGVRNGIERISKLALPLFFGLFIVLIVRALTLDGAMTGLRELLVPRWRNFAPSTALAALGQAVFSLGVGGMFMVAYGSYMRSAEDIPRNAMATAAADVVAALMAGLIVFPAAFALNVPIDSGPALLFSVMPEVFAKMPAGGWFGAAFFFSIFIVALLSLTAAYEVIVAALADGLGWSRTRSLTIVFVSQILLSLPALLIGSYIAVSDLIWGSTMQPIGAVIAVVALTWSLGQTRALDEMRRNSVLPIPTWLFYWLKFVVPTGILVTLGYGWFEKLTSQ